jgi:uncharacterized membrane protein YqhA
MNSSNGWFGRTLVSTKYLAFVTVFVSLISAVSLYIFATLAAFDTIADAFAANSWEMADVKRIAVSLLTVVDFLLIAGTLHFISVGTYKLFLNDKLKVPKPMDVTDYSGLKMQLITIVSTVLLILFLEAAIKPEEAPIGVLEFGIAVSLVITAGSIAGLQAKKTGTGVRSDNPPADALKDEPKGS